MVLGLQGFRVFGFRGFSFFGKVWGALSGFLGVLGWRLGVGVHGFGLRVEGLVF